MGEFIKLKNQMVEGTGTHSSSGDLGSKNEWAISAGCWSSNELAPAICFAQVCVPQCMCVSVRIQIAERQGLWLS